MGLFARDIGMDLGTANTLVYVKGRGVVIREPSVVAIDRGAREVIAVGDEARQMMGRTPEGIDVVRPLRDGVIADFDVTRAMLRYFIRRSGGAGFGFRPRTLICVSSGATDVERRAIETAAIEAGAREALLIEEPLAAAGGAGMPIGSPKGCMAMDIGGGTAETASIVDGGIVACFSTRVAGDAFDEAIAAYVRRELLVEIGMRTAEEIKIAIGSAIARPKDISYEVRGRDVMDGMPKVAELYSSQVAEALREPLLSVVETARLAVENTPPEIVARVARQGMVLTGGGAFLFGIDQLIYENIGIMARTAPFPLDCVALGMGLALEGDSAPRALTR